MGSSRVDKYKLISFDFDDTLVQTRGPIWDLHRFVAIEHFGVELTDEALHVHWGKSLPQLAIGLYQTDKIEQAVDLMHKYLDDFPKVAIADTMPTLRHLKMAQKILGIVTASTRPIITGDVVHTGIDLELFDYIQTSEDTTVHKPDPEVFNPLLEWADEQRIATDAILYIGDSLHDMNAAQGAGLDFIGVCTGLFSAEEFTRYGAKSINNLSELT